MQLAVISLQNELSRRASSRFAGVHSVPTSLQFHSPRSYSTGSKLDRQRQLGVEGVLEAGAEWDVDVTRVPEKDPRAAHPLASV
jgi:hypothetical protein